MTKSKTNRRRPPVVDLDDHLTITRRFTSSLGVPLTRLTRSAISTRERLSGSVLAGQSFGGSRGQPENTSPEDRKSLSLLRISTLSKNTV
jgi:hypothetical protein